MASNSFGQLFRITTWGESHGPAIGVVIDGCPPGVEICQASIQMALNRRAPGMVQGTSPRREPDQLEIYSGIFEGKTTGTPISMIIFNRDVDSSKYEPIAHILRPGHAQYTYLEKYGIYDYRGGGRASARETACRVAAGALAQQVLAAFEVRVYAYLTQVGDLTLEMADFDYLSQSSLHCASAEFELALKALLQALQAEGNSVGGRVGFEIHGLPRGLGDPVYEKFEAKLAQGMMSIPASKGFEFGLGFASVSCYGRDYNDIFGLQDEQISLQSNHAGGCLGGITTGLPVYGQVAFKPTSSIQAQQASVTLDGVEQIFALPQGSRHDPCVAIRGVPVVAAMAYLVALDTLLMQRVITC